MSDLDEESGIGEVVVISEKNNSNESEGEGSSPEEPRFKLARLKGSRNQ